MTFQDPQVLYLARRNRGTARGGGARGRGDRARVNHARGRDANQPPINWSSTYQAPEPPPFNEPHPENSVL